MYEKSFASTPTFVILQLFAHAPSGNWASETRMIGGLQSMGYKGSIILECWEAAVSTGQTSNSRFYNSQPTNGMEL